MASIDQRLIGVLVGCLVGFFVNDDLGLLLGGFVGAFYADWCYRFVGAVMSWLCGLLAAIVFGVACGFLGVIILLLSGNTAELLQTLKRCQAQAQTEPMTNDQMLKCYGFGPNLVFAVSALVFLTKLVAVVAGNFYGATLACRWAWLSIAQQGNLTAIAKLLQSGVDVNRSDSSTGRTALHAVAESGNLEAVTALLVSGAFVDKPDKSNCTALHLAAQNGSLAVVKALVDADCNVEHRATDGSIAYDRAIRNRHTAVAEYLLQAQHQRPYDAVADRPQAQAGAAPIPLMSVVCGNTDNA